MGQSNTTLNKKDTDNKDTDKIDTDKIDNTNTDNKVNRSCDTNLSKKVMPISDINSLELIIYLYKIKQSLNYCKYGGSKSNEEIITELEIIIDKINTQCT